MRCGDPVFCKAPQRKTAGFKRATASEAATYNSSLRTDGTPPRPSVPSLAGYKNQRLSRRINGEGK